MSDFNDILNDNAGYYAALGGLAGVSQRNRVLDTQNRQIQQQAQQHAEHSRQIAAHAARVEDLESQRLEIEERRLDLESRRADAEQERRDEIRAMRRCLSKLMTELEALPRVFTASPKGRSPELTIRLATLQAACGILTSRDIFEELSDMQALSQFDRDLGIFIAQKALEGSTWADPSARIVEEENARFAVAKQAIKLLGDSSAAMQTLCAKPLYSFSTVAININPAYKSSDNGCNSSMLGSCPREMPATYHPPSLMNFVHALSRCGKWVGVAALRRPCWRFITTVSDVGWQPLIWKAPGPSFQPSEDARQAEAEA